MQSLEQLFVHELQEMLATKQAVSSLYQRLGQCGTSPQLQQHFGTHGSETRTQIDRLHQILSMLGQQPAPGEANGVTGILRDHDRTEQQYRMSPQVHTAFDVGIGQKIAQYEVGAYQHLVTLATTLGYQQAADALQTSLGEERQQVQRLQQTANAIDYARPAGQPRSPPSQQQGAGGQVRQQGPPPQQ